MLSEFTDQSSLQQLETELNIVLALMERDFPIDIQVFVVVVFFLVIASYMHLSYVGDNNASTPPYRGWYESFWASICYLDVCIRKI